MKDPQRLLRGGKEAERALLLAADEEQPPADGEQRLRAALGLTAVVVGVTAVSTTSTASGAAATSTVASQVAAPAASAAGVGGVLKTSAAKLALKWALIAASSVGVVTTAWVATRPEPLAHVVSRPRQVPAPTHALPGEVSSPAELPAVTLTPVPARQRTVRDRQAPGARSIAGETARLDAVRLAIHRGEAQTALRLLQRYEREHAAGVLRQEARVLRIEALALAGDVERARALGLRFLHDNRQSPHAERVRALLRMVGNAP